MPELTAEEKLYALRCRIEAIVPYVLATIGPGCTRPGSKEDWIEVHKGRAHSSHRQLERLLHEAKEALS